MIILILIIMIIIIRTIIIMTIITIIIKQWNIPKLKRAPNKARTAHRSLYVDLAGVCLSFERLRFGKDVAAVLLKASGTMGGSQTRGTPSKIKQQQGGLFPGSQGLSLHAGPPHGGCPFAFSRNGDRPFAQRGRAILLATLGGCWAPACLICDDDWDQLTFLPSTKMISNKITY